MPGLSRTGEEDAGGFRNGSCPPRKKQSIDGERGLSPPLYGNKNPGKLKGGAEKYFIGLIRKSRSPQEKSLTHRGKKRGWIASISLCAGGKSLFVFRKSKRSGNFRAEGALKERFLYSPSLEKIRKRS